MSEKSKHRQRVHKITEGVESIEEVLVEVVPIHKPNERNEQEWNFTAIHADELDTPVELSGRWYIDGDGGVWSFYGKRPPIFIQGDNIYTVEGSDVNEAENQAYFTLSILAERGKVSRWTKA